MKLSIVLFIIIAIIAGLFIFSGCEKSEPVAPSLTSGGGTMVEFTKKPTTEYTYPIWGKQNFYKKHGVWQGGTITLSNGSKFTIEDGAMTPPHPNASSYYLTVRADFDSLRNEIIVSFTPGGCVFDPPAELILDWNDLEIEIAALYYIDDNGNYILQTPNHIDPQKRNLTIYIDHFSRYAIGAE